MQELATKPEPILAKLPRQPGQKETRYQQLFTGAVPAEAVAPGAIASGAPSEEPDRVAQLEKRVAALEAAVKGLDAQRSR
jgi:uncharacterized protein YceH (UPF0502 family)